MKYLQELWSSRELLWNLASREVRGQYKRTIFGQLWSLANPLVLMVIYTFIFGFIFKSNPPPGNPSGLDIFALWLLCGLLPWTFLANVVNASASSLVANAGLIQKVSFSRAVLPLSQVGSNAYNWAFEMAVLLIAVSVVGGFVLPWLPLLLVGMFLLAVFASGLGLLFAVANVYFRDTQYLLSIALQMWMYLTPIIYPMRLVRTESDKWGGIFGTPVTVAEIYNLNPMVHFVELFRALIYDNRFPSGANWMICIGWAVVTLVVGFAVFRRNERKLAEIL